MLQVREQQQTKILALTGQFTHDTKIDIQMLILAAKETGYQHIVLNFSRVTEIDSTSLSELFLWYHNIKPNHPPISVVKPPSYMRYHSDWLHLEEIVSIYASEKEAVKDTESLG